MRSKKKPFVNYPKHILQLGFLGVCLYFVIRSYINPYYFVNFEAVCPLGGIQAGLSFLIRGSLACSMTSIQIFIGILFLIAIILFSKLFCAFVCPIGTIAEWLGKLGEKWKIRYTIMGIPDKLLRSLKYLLLFVTFYYTLQSSELFCKKFDPYYAAATGFGYDVNFTWAILSIGVVILGSLFFRMFWCKYLCPLGALSNIFKYFLITAGVIGIYIVLLHLDVNLPFAGPLAVICIVCYILEIWKQRSISIPLHWITRDSESCIQCQRCSMVCHQGINVAAMDEVEHIDCNLCGDCLMVCPVTKTLTINNKAWLKWIPPILTVLLITVGITFGNRIEIPTIEERWGTPEQVENAAVLTRTGLKEIKCYGSSMSFANKLRKINGIVGVSTFVRTHTVKILYDPMKINEQRILSSIFVPEKRMIHRPSNKVKRIAQVELLVDNFFDIYDTQNFTDLLRTDPEILGFTSEFGCPVKINVFLHVPDDGYVNFHRLKELIETKELYYLIEGLKEKRNLNFKVVDYKIKNAKISRIAFLERMFQKYRNLFQPYYRRNNEDISSFEFQFPDIEKPEMQKWLPYLSSYLSLNLGVLGIETRLINGTSWGKIYFDAELITIEQIMELLKKDTLMVRLSNGEDRKYINPFTIHFPEENSFEIRLDDQD